MYHGNVKYIIYNDIGVCLYYMRKPSEALMLWDESLKCLNQQKMLTGYRYYRIVFNKVLVHLNLGSNPKIYMEQWERAGQLLAEQMPSESLEYFYYLKLYGWIYFREGHLDKAFEITRKAYSLGQEILSENNENIADINYMLALITMQCGDVEQSRLYLKRSHNITKNKKEMLK